MNYSRLLVGTVVLGLATLAPAAMASGKSDSIRSSRSASKKGATETVSVSSSSSSNPHSRFGLGFATGSFGDSSTALSAWFDLNESMSIQPLFYLGGTSPFTFGAGANFRSTISGDQKNGFHVGGGLMLGIANKGGSLGSGVQNIVNALGGSSTGTTGFYVNITPMAGAHFTINGLDRVMFSVEGGAGILILDGKANFSINTLSSLLGLSVHYFL